MLSSLCRLCIITDGSSRESDVDPAELVGGFAPYVFARLRRYSSSTARFLRFRKKKKTPPAIALKATMPATTPAAMPALLGPLDCGACIVVIMVSLALVSPGAVTTMVLAFVIADGGSLSVGVGWEDDVDDDAAAALSFELGSELDPALASELGLESREVACTVPTLLFNPVSCTDQVFGPPPIALLALISLAKYIISHKSPNCNRHTWSCTVSLRLCYWIPEEDLHTNNWILGWYP